MNCIKKLKYRIQKDELTRLIDAQYATGDLWRYNSRKNEETKTKQKKSTKLWMGLVMKVKSDAVKNNIAYLEC